MVQWYEASLFVLEEVGMQVQNPAALIPVFFFFIFFIMFLPFGLFLFILTADPI